MLKKLLLFTGLILMFQTVNAQYTASNMRHYIKVEGSYLFNYKSNVSSNPEDMILEDNGKNVNLIWGWDFDERVLLGVGAGYLNLDGMDGLNVLGNVNFFVSNSHISPFLGARGGYSVIWPLNSDGSGSILAEFTSGVKIRVGNCRVFTFFIQSGLSYTQNTLYVPVRFAIVF